MGCKHLFLSPILCSSVNVCPMELCNSLTVQSCSLETHLYAETG